MLKVQRMIPLIRSGAFHVLCPVMQTLSLRQKLPINSSWLPAFLWSKQLSFSTFFPPSLTSSDFVCDKDSIRFLCTCGCGGKGGGGAVFHWRMLGD